MKSILAGLMIIFSLSRYSEAGPKFGPHGGYLAMVGLFYSELMQDSDGSFHIYLLDVDLKNPVVKDSEVQAWFILGNTSVELKCEAIGGDHFDCVPRSKVLKSKILLVKAKRVQVQGQETIFKLPNIQKIN